jgi:hypothetical protein
MCLSLPLCGPALAEEKAKTTLLRPDSRKSFQRGQEIIGKLSALTKEETAKFDIGAYRGEVVTFIGGSAPPGGTNDLVMAGGYYLRIVNPQNKDLRPHSVWWEGEVTGTILQVLPKNKIIVIEVQEKDWVVRQTG